MPFPPPSPTEVAMRKEMAALKERVADDEKTNAQVQGDLKLVTDKLQFTQTQLSKARVESEAKQTQTTEMVHDLNNSVQTELATKASTDDVKTVDTKVTQVSSDLDKTNNDLAMARSELGTLVARNHDEIDTLRRMAELKLCGLHSNTTQAFPENSLLQLSI